MRGLRSMLFAAALAVPACAAHAGVGVYIGAVHPAYHEFVPDYPDPGYTAGYYSDGAGYPGRWAASERRREREFEEHRYRSHEYREHEGWKRRDGDDWRGRERERQGWKHRDHDDWRERDNYRDRQREDWQR